jgi:predicted DNA-binding antitoxin AbrB/MazE fold protein
MVSVNGIYEDGRVKLLEPVDAPPHARVIVTFLREDEPKEGKFDVSRLSYKETSELLSGLTTSLSDAVMEERRSYQ